MWHNMECIIFLIHKMKCVIFYFECVAVYVGIVMWEQKQSMIPSPLYNESSACRSAAAALDTAVVFHRHGVVLQCLDQILK